MEFSAYLAAWTFYLLAAAGISLMTWRVLQRYLLLELALLLQCLFMALLFMPWPVLEGEQILAPAFIVALMDSITEAPQAGIRAFAPLVMAMVGSVLLAFVLALLIRLWVRRHKTRAEEEKAPPPAIRQGGVEEELEPRPRSDGKRRPARGRRGAAAELAAPSPMAEPQVAASSRRPRQPEAAAAAPARTREPDRAPAAPRSREPQGSASGAPRRRRPTSGSRRRDPRD